MVSLLLSSEESGYSNICLTYKNWHFIKLNKKNILDPNELKDDWEVYDTGPRYFFTLSA